MRPIITVSAVVLLHLCVVAVLVGVNGCRSTSGYEKEPDLSAYSAGARSAAPAPGLVAAPGLVPAPAPVATLTTPKPTKVAPVTVAGAGGTHTVVKGESLSLIASREKVSIDDLAAANGLSRSSIVREGQKLKIPAPGAAKKAAVKPTTDAKKGPTDAKKAGGETAAPAAPVEPLKIVRFTAEPAPAVAAPDAGAPAPAPAKK
jgi:LysM repeat protein